MDDGGPAFPVRFSLSDGSETLLEGMSLRDHFAGQALVTLNTIYPHEAAKRAYEIADTMLIARGS